MKDKIDIDQADLCCQIYDLIEKGKAGEAVLLLRSYIAKELPKKHEIEIWDETDRSDDYCNECGQFDYTCNYNRCLKDIKQSMGVE